MNGGEDNFIINRFIDFQISFIMIKLIDQRLKMLCRRLIYFNSKFKPVETIVTKFQIADKKVLNHDTYIYYLTWAGPKFNLGIGQHFRIVQNIPTYQHPEGEQIFRKYTPINMCSKQDLIQLLVKIYRPNSNPNFPQGGKLTPYLQKLKIGDFINVDGPFGKFQYKGKGVIKINGKQHKMKKIFFIAGGSGITPCYQTIRQIANLPNQTIQMTLLFANKTQADIVLKKQIQELQPRLEVHYCLDNPPKDWKEYSGFVTKQMLEKICKLDDPETMYIHCGPGAMNAHIRQIFAKHYPKSVLFKY